MAHRKKCDLHHGLNHVLHHGFRFFFTNFYTWRNLKITPLLYQILLKSRKNWLKNKEYRHLFLLVNLF